MSNVRIPRTIRKAVKLALAAPSDNNCAACGEPYHLEPGDDATACCHPCAQMLLAMVADFVDCLRTGRRHE